MFIADLMLLYIEFYILWNVIHLQNKERKNINNAIIVVDILHNMHTYT